MAANKASRICWKGQVVLRDHRSWYLVNNIAINVVSPRMNLLSNYSPILDWYLTLFTTNLLIIGFTLLAINQQVDIVNLFIIGFSIINNYNMWYSWEIQTNTHRFTVTIRGMLSASLDRRNSLKKTMQPSCGYLCPVIYPKKFPKITRIYIYIICSIYIYICVCE